MKKYYKMYENSGKILPLSWYKEYLNNQLNGLTGHIENAGYPYDSVSWCNYNDESLKYYGEEWKWVPFEQTAYYLDGASKLAYLLDDKDLKKKTDSIIYNTLNNVKEDGFIGPDFLRPTTVNNRWPHTVFFRAVIEKYHQNHDISLIQKIENHYLNSPADYSKTRNVTNIEPMLLVYEITKNPKLLELAIKTYEDFHNDVEAKSFDAVNHFNLRDELLNKEAPYEHGVTYNEIAKLGAILYGYTGDKKYLKPVINAYKKIEKFHMQADGLHSCNEFFRGKSPSESHETCDVSDYTWALGYLLMATGDGHYADLIEKCIYNAGIGCTLENFKAFQYFSSVNQLVLDEHSNHCFYRYGKSWMSYLPTHEVQCCAGNVNRFMPNFVSRMYMRKNKNIFCIFYGGSDYETKIGGKKVIIHQKGNYPFDENINLTIEGNYEGDINVYLRIPKWCSKPSIFVDGINMPVLIKKGFMALKNVKIGNSIKLVLPQEIKIEKYQNNGVCVTLGPVLYALGMKGDRSTYLNESIKNEDYPGYKIYPDKEYRYGIDYENANPKLIKLDSNEFPWSLDTVPYAIEVEAYKIPKWKIIEKKKVNTTDFENKSIYFTMKADFKFTPKVKSFSIEETDGKEKILLYPYGACKIRLGVLPRIK